MKPTMRRSFEYIGAAALPALAAVIVGLGALAFSAPPRPRPPRHAPAAHPRPARPPARYVHTTPRPAAVAPRTVPRLRAVPVVYTGGGTVVVTGTSGDTGQTDAGSTAENEIPSDGKTTVPAIVNPSDVDKSLAGSTAYEVLRVEDGGLTVVLDVDGQETPVRMLGVAPVEFTRPRNAETSSRGGQPDRPVPIQMFLENLLRGESVYVVYDSQVENQDEDGKFVAYLYRAPDGLLINQEVIRQGFGVTDTSYTFEEQPSFRHYQEKAQKAQKGLWRAPQGKGGREPRPRPAGKPT